MFRTLSEEGINIQMISTSEIKTSVVIDEKYMELAVRALHRAFDLDGEPTARLSLPHDSCCRGRRGHHRSLAQAGAAGDALPLFDDEVEQHRFSRWIDDADGDRLVVSSLQIPACAAPRAARSSRRRAGRSPACRARA